MNTSRLNEKGTPATGAATLRRATCWMGLLVITGLPSMASAVQQDAEYYVQEKRFGKQWTAEDKQVRDKLATLEKKFGKKPNIIYILADDTGYTELGAYGGGIRGFKTPNLDQMARQGMRFLSYYSQPACTFTRLSLMTGRIPTRTGLAAVLFPGTRGAGLTNYEVTIAELLSDAGYTTAMYGKWHKGAQKIEPLHPSYPIMRRPHADLEEKHELRGDTSTRQINNSKEII